MRGRRTCSARCALQHRTDESGEMEQEQEQEQRKSRASEGTRGASGTRQPCYTLGPRSVPAVHAPPHLLPGADIDPFVSPQARPAYPAHPHVTPSPYCPTRRRTRLDRHRERTPTPVPCPRDPSARPSASLPAKPTPAQILTNTPRPSFPSRASLPSPVSSRSRISSRTRTLFRTGPAGLCTPSRVCVPVHRLPTRNEATGSRLKITPCFSSALNTDPGL